MTTIRNILIITVIAALVPTAMSNVSAPADAEIALFSGASVDTDSLFITGNSDSAKMELKATNDNGKSSRVSGFLLTADNVLTTEVGDKVTVKDNVDFTKAITTDSRNNQKVMGITSNGVIDFAGYAQGVYILDVVVDDDRAYEAIIVIGGQTQDSVKSVNKEVIFEIYSGNYTGGGGSGNITSSGSGGGSNMTENGNFAGSDGDGGSNMTQGITEFATVPEQPEPINEVFCVPEETLVDGKCVLNPLVWEPEPESVIGECFDGATPVDGKCPNPTREPACQALGCPGSPPDPGYEPLVPPEEAVVPQPVFEEVEDQDIDETELDEEKTGEDDDVEVEETVEEDTEEVEESEEDESGESEDEAEDEGSEQESEGESEEESEGGN